MSSSFPAMAFVRMLSPGDGESKRFAMKVAARNEADFFGFRQVAALCFHWFLCSPTLFPRVRQRLPERVAMSKGSMVQSIFRKFVD
jgi:hypothetical protein